MTRALLAHALDALVRETYGESNGSYEVIDALRSALAQPEAEPVAWAQNPKEGFWVWCLADEADAIPIYVAPQAQPTPATYAMGYAEGFNDACKPAVAEPLTEDRLWNSREIMSANAALGLAMPQLLGLVRAIEQAHGIGIKGRAA